MSRFDYIKYDETATFAQARCKDAFEILEETINRLPDGRAKSLALTSLEESYMWVGKALRDDQLARNNEPSRELPERCNS